MPNPARQEQIDAFLAAHGYGDAQQHPLAGDASFRRYIRIRGQGDTAMLMDAPPGKEDVRPFIAIAGYLHGKGYSAPAILAREEPAGLLLLEDLGDDSFSAVLRASADAEPELYEAAIDVLAQWHDASRVFTNRQALPLPDYGHTLLMREVMLFPEWFLPQALGKEQAAALAGEYEALWQDILAQAPLSTQHWVHRDYHADNLMWLPSRRETQRVGLLDFQDGVYGDAAYDLVSLLEDARRDVPPPLANAMLARYMAVSGADREQFLAAYALLGAQRNSKIIGIFSRLAARDGKHHYLQYLPRVWRHLEKDVQHPLLAPLKEWLDKHIPADKRGIIPIRQAA